MHSGISVSMLSQKDMDFEALSEQWRQLEKKSDSSFFLTWSWIGQWLQQLPNEYFVLQAKCDEKVVGLCIICKNVRKLFGLIPVKQWWINRSGIEVFDQCWTEENGILTDASLKEEVTQTIITYIKAESDWQELILGMTDEENCNTFASLTKECRIIVDDEGYLVDFNQVHESYKLDVLSRNTRQKVRQTEKLLNKQGELSFNVLSDVESKMLQLNEISTLHVARWQNTATPSGFQNPSFMKMMSALLHNSKIEIAVLNLNNNPIGYLINFAHGQKVNFYLSALSTFSDPKIKVGLLLQTKAIEYYHAQGFSYYDFLAGKAQYKGSLSNVSYKQKMMLYYRTNFSMMLENLCRKLKNYFE